MEEQFYLAWPAVVLFTPRRFLLHDGYGGLTLSSPARLRDHGAKTAGADLRRDHRPPCPLSPWMPWAPAHLAFVRDACTAETVARLRKALPYLALASAGLYALAKISARKGYTGEATTELAGCVFTFAFVWIVDRASVGFRGPAKSLLEWRPLTYLGEISYGLYVYHLMLLEAGLVHARTAPGILTIIGPPGLQRFSVVLAVTVVVASLSWWFFFGAPLNDLEALPLHECQSGTRARG